MTPLIDCHCHCPYWLHIDGELYFKDRKIPAWAWTVLRGLRAALHGLDDVDALDALQSGIELAARLFRVDDDMRRTLELVELFYTPIPQQIARLQAMWQANGIAGGYILIPAVGDYRRATRDITQLTNFYDNIQVFAPWQCSDEPGVFGVKYYPALEGRAVLPQVVGCNTPIIAHCSPGGIRRGQRSEAAERADNAPGWVLDALAINPKARIILAHGGGEGAFLRACDPTKDAPIKNLIRDHGGPGTEHPEAWIGVDTAFHEGIGSQAYRGRWLGTDALMIGHVLIGSDWPLHLPKYAYSTWARRGRYTFGTSLDGIDAARVAFEGRE